MDKYEQIISKFRTIKASKELEGNPYPNYNAGVISPAELEIITEALEFTQFLEIIFKERLSKAKLENHG